MKIVLTCGHPYGGFLRVHELLAAAGLGQLRPAINPPMSATELREKILATHGVAPDGAEGQAQVHPGPELRAAAERLLVANSPAENCGWADAGSVWLLDFWKSLSPAVRFVLVYSTPEQAIGDMLSAAQGELADIDRLVAGWVASNNEMLRFYHRNRDRCQLVNVCAAEASPAKLIATISAAFSVGLSTSGISTPTPHARSSAVAASLSHSLIEGFDDVVALYRELESSADVEGGVAGKTADDKQRAWHEFIALTAELDAARNAAADETQRKQHEFVALTAELDGARNAAADEKQRTHRELATLTAELNAARNDAADQKGKQIALQGKCEATEKQLADLRRELEQSRLALKTAEETALRWQHELSQMQTKNSELAQVSQLQVLQVKQVQEELGHYFSRYQEVLESHKADSRELAVLRRFWRNNQPAESMIDLKGEIDGDNWYYPEKDGRWAGPADVSTLNFPRLQAGNYKIQIDVSDAMEPEILAGMEVAVNGIVLDLKHQGRRYPTRAYAQFSVDETELRPLWEIRFKFPKLVCPAQHGSTDERLLAVRVQSVHLTLLD